MSWIDIALLFLIALCVAWAIKKIARHETGGCDGNCAHCGQKCKKRQ